MGTRHLTCVVKDGAFKVAQYGQWDGYPEGQGATIVEFLQRIQKQPDGLERFNQAVANCRFISKEEIVQRWVEAGAEDPESAFVDPTVADTFEARYPQLSRDIGAGVLEYIFNQNGAELADKHTFAADSLFCEWAYVIDLDHNILEVYTGFNKTNPEPKGRFRDLPREPRHYEGAEQYYPIELLGVFHLDPLPSVEDFVELVRGAADVREKEKENGALA